jgi:hypothetical protein
MSAGRRSRERSAGLIGAVIIVIGCSDGTAPVIPEPEAPASITPEAQTPMPLGPRLDAEPVALTRPANAGSVAPAVQDATDRVAVSLAHLGPAVELRATLQGLVGALSGSDRELSARLGAQARRLLTRLRATPGSSAIGPELSAIELALDAAERELGASNAVDDR